MKNLFFLIVLTGLTYSCKQENKTSQSNNNPQEKTAPKKVEQLNIDALTASPANFKLLFENEHVRILEYTVNPGEKDQWHTHPAKSSYVVSGGKLKVHLENGEIINADDSTGSVAWMNYVGKHYVENIGNTAVKIILTEVKALQ